MGDGNNIYPRKGIKIGFCPIQEHMSIKTKVRISTGSFIYVLHFYLTDRYCGTKRMILVQYSDLF